MLNDQTINQAHPLISEVETGQYSTQKKVQWQIQNHFVDFSQPFRIKKSHALVKKLENLTNKGNIFLLKNF